MTDPAVTPEMIEAVKAAIFISAAERWCDWPTPDHPECVRLARAAIDAMERIRRQSESEP